MSSRLPSTPSTLGAPAGPLGASALDADRAHPPRLDPAASERMFAGLMSEVAAPLSLRARLAERSTGARLLLALAGIGATMGLVLLVFPPRLDDQAPAGLLLAALSFAGVVGGLALGLRGLQRPPPSPALRLFLGAAPWAPLVFAALLAEGPISPPAEWLLRSSGCLSVGLGVGAISVLGGWWLQREKPGSLWRLGALAAVAGFSDWALLSMHCPSRELAHLLVGHGLGGLVVGVGLLALRRR